MESIWARIEEHLQKHPALKVSSQPFFNPPATEEEILAAEAALGLAFPADFRASLKLHNGQARSEPLLGKGSLLSTAEIVSNWRLLTEMLEDGTFDDFDGEGGEGVKEDWWNKRWVPITSNGGGDFDCLDMDPAEGGSVGQVIDMGHDDGATPLLARSFSAWVARLAEDLEAGRLAWDEDEELFLMQEK